MSKLFTHFIEVVIGGSCLPGGSLVKNLPANAKDAGSIPGSGRLLEGGNGNPLQYCCMENPMDRGAWQAIDHGVTKSRTQLSAHTQTHTCFPHDMLPSDSQTVI